MLTYVTLYVSMKLQRSLVYVIEYNGGIPMFKFKALTSSLLAIIITASLCTPAFASYNEQTSFLNPFTLAKVYRDDKKAVEEIYKNMDKLLAEGAEYEKNNPPQKTEQAMSRSDALGTVGDILVNFKMNSSGSTSSFVGHAAIVSSKEHITIESFSKAFSPKNVHGVERYTNNWERRPGAMLLRPKDASARQYSSSANYAFNQLGKPYNGNFFNKNRTDQFYCSQLVWRAWLESGIDIEAGTVPNGIISPSDLVRSSNTYLVKEIK